MEAILLGLLQALKSEMVLNLVLLLVRVLVLKRLFCLVVVL